MIHRTIITLCKIRTTIASNDRIIRLSITRIRTTPRTMMGHPRRRTYYINTTHAYNANTDSDVCTGITHKTKADTATTIDIGVHNYTSTNSNTQSTMNTDAHATRVRRRAHTWWRVRLRIPTHISRLNLSRIVRIKLQSLRTPIVLIIMTATRIICILYRRLTYRL